MTQNHVPSGVGVQVPPPAPYVVVILAEKVEQELRDAFRELQRARVGRKARIAGVVERIDEGIGERPDVVANRAREKRAASIDDMLGHDGIVF